MPRTKLTKKVTNKRNRNSTIDELRVNAIGEVDRGKWNFFNYFLAGNNFFDFENKHIALVI